MRSFLCNGLEPFAYLIYALALLLTVRHNRSIKYKVLSVFYAACALLLYIGILYYDNNYWTYNLLFFANIIILSWYYFKLFEDKFKKQLTVAGGIFNAIIFIYVNIFLHKYNEYNAVVYCISFITIVSYSLLYLHQLLLNMQEESLLLNFDFWLACGYLLYFLGSFIIVLYYNHSNDFKLRGNMWQMHNIILFICAAVTLYVSLRISKKNNLHHA